MVTIAMTGSACDDTEKEKPVDALFVSQIRVALSVDGGRETIAVNASAAWSAEPSADWIVLSVAENTITIVAESNPGEEIRTAEVIVATTTCREVVTVTQEGIEAGSSMKLYYDPAKCVMDSEGAEFTATIIASGDWEAWVDNDWFVLDVDRRAGLIRVSVPVNEDASYRVARLSVSSGGSTRLIGLSQQPRSENPYFQLTGTWNMGASLWIYNNKYLQGGSYLSCRFVADKYNSTYEMWDLGLKGSGMYVAYQPDEGIVNAPLGTYVGASSSYMYYLCAFALTEDSVLLSFEGALLFEPTVNGMQMSCSLGEDYPFFGIVGYNGMNYVLFSNIYYALCEGVTLTPATGDTAVSAFSAETDIESGFSDASRKRGHLRLERSQCTFLK